MKWFLRTVCTHIRHFFFPCFVCIYLFAFIILLVKETPNWLNACLVCTCEAIHLMCLMLSMQSKTARLPLIDNQHSNWRPMVTTTVVNCLSMTDSTARCWWLSWHVLRHVSRTMEHWLSDKLRFSSCAAIAFREYISRVCFQFERNCVK